MLSETASVSALTASNQTSEGQGPAEELLSRVPAAVPPAKPVMPPDVVNRIAVCDCSLPPHCSIGSADQGYLCPG